MQRNAAAQHTGNVNLQPGLGIIPMLFGLNNSSGTCNTLHHDQTAKYDWNVQQNLHGPQVSCYLSSIMRRKWRLFWAPYAWAAASGILHDSVVFWALVISAVPSKHCSMHPVPFVHQAFSPGMLWLLSLVLRLQAFLSRLLLMLGSFVIMCLLLFWVANQGFSGALWSLMVLSCCCCIGVKLVCIRPVAMQFVNTFDIPILCHCSLLLVQAQRYVLRWVRWQCVGRLSRFVGSVYNSRLVLLGFKNRYRRSPVTCRQAVLCSV